MSKSELMSMGTTSKMALLIPFCLLTSLVNTLPCGVGQGLASGPLGPCWWVTVFHRSEYGGQIFR